MILEGTTSAKRGKRKRPERKKKYFPNFLII